MISGGDEAAVCRWRRASLPRKSLLRAINGKCQNCSPRHLRTMGKQPSSLDDVWGSHHRGGNHGKQHVSKSGGQNYLVSSRCFISISLVGGHVCYEMRRILITPIGAACEDVRHPVTCGRLSGFVFFFFADCREMTHVTQRFTGVYAEAVIGALRQNVLANEFTAA